MEKKIYILAGGPPENVPDLAPYAEDKQAAWAGVDRGVLHLLKQGIIPEMAFGDFDSVNQEEWAGSTGNFSISGNSSPKKMRPIWSWP